MRQIYIHFLLIILAQTANSQVPRTQISVTDFKVNNAIVMGNSETTIVNSLGPYVGMGTPLTVIENWEIEGVTVKVLRYLGQGEFKMLDGKLRDFEITGSGIPIHYNGSIFKVGDNISVLSTIFPVSFTNRYTKTIVLDIVGTSNGQTIVSDEGFAIHYDPNTNLITKIRYSRRP